MDELFNCLETKIKELIDRENRLKMTNQQLQQSKMHVALEKDTLFVKQQKAILQVESLIAKLKALEE